MTLFEYSMQWVALLTGMWLTCYAIIYMVSPAQANRFRGWTGRQLATFVRWMGRSLGHFIAQNPIPFGVALIVLIIFILAAIRIQ